MEDLNDIDGMDEILKDFVVETNDLIEQLNEDLLLLESGDRQPDLINRIFRAFHTIKGTSSFLNFSACTELAHAAEDILNCIRNDGLEPTSSIIDALLDTIDWFKGFISDVENQAVQNYDTEEMVSALKNLLAEEQKKSGQETSENEAEITKTTAPTTRGEAINLEMPPELIEEFTSEAGELLETLSNDLLSLEIESTNETLINTLFRTFHTLKGNSGLIGLKQMFEVAHRAEDVLSMIRDKKLEPGSAVIDALLATVDLFKVIVDEVKERRLTTHDTAEIENNLDKILGRQPVKKAVGEEPAGEKEVAKTAPVTAKHLEQTIRVDVDRLNNLMNLAGELILEKNRFQQLNQLLNAKFSGNKEVSDLDSLNNSLGRITTEIQESVMRMRMLPISNVFRKFPRLVRDLAKEKNKEIELVIAGETTELDRSLIEAIGDPLVHLLRNSIDHGIEEPAIRLSAGKPAKGTINMSAYQSGNDIIIEVADDGAGIDPEKIASKAVEKGLITEDQARSLPRREIINLIFEAGFSTAKVITDVSGRGVGMDVVRSNVAKLNGSVDIRTEVGRGTTFIIKLPLTLTIMNGMVVKVQDEVYIIPIGAITDTLKLSNYRISLIKGREFITLRDSVVPIIYLENLFDVKKTTSDDTERYVVVASVSERKVGLVVTGIFGQEETVVKSLGPLLGKVPFIAGASIRGDGRVALILDTGELISCHNRS
jgi:two-component system chemotaxis sensor kinase CheA